MTEGSSKSELRKHLKEVIAAIPDGARHARSIAATSLLSASAEFQAANTVMLFMSMPDEIDTAPLALKCWQAGKTVVVPKVSWTQRRMLPVEIHSLTCGIATTGNGIREPVEGKPVPLEEIDMVVVPGLGFSPEGYRIGRGMGFYDRFLAHPEFHGITCGFAFSEQLVPTLPIAPHDVALGMLATDAAIRRFSVNCIRR